MTLRQATSHAIVFVACLLAIAPGLHAQATPDSLRAGGLTFHFRPDRAAFARLLAGDSAALVRLPALPHDVLTGAPVPVWLASDEAHFAQLTGGRAPEWGAGVAMSNPERVVLPAFESSERGAAGALRRVLRHELAHVALTRYLAPAYPPRWFHEGYARWAAGEWDWEEAWALRLAFALHRAPPLDSLALEWPRDVASARVAYALATSTVAFLIERGGERALAHMLARWRETGSLDTAVRRTYGLTLSQLEEDWRDDVRRSYGWLFFLSHSVLFWLAVTVLTLLVFVGRRRHTQRRLAALRADELPDRPAFWLEEESGEEVGEPGREGDPAPSDYQSRS